MLHFHGTPASFVVLKSLKQKIKLQIFLQCWQWYCSLQMCGYINHRYAWGMNFLAVEIHCGSNIFALDSSAALNFFVEFCSINWVFTHLGIPLSPFYNWRGEGEFVLDFAWNGHFTLCREEYMYKHTWYVNCLWQYGCIPHLGRRLVFWGKIWVPLHRKKFMLTREGILASYSYQHTIYYI